MYIINLKLGNNINEDDRQASETIYQKLLRSPAIKNSHDFLACLNIHRELYGIPLKRVVNRRGLRSPELTNILLALKNKEEINSKVNCYWGN